MTHVVAQGDALYRDLPWRGTRDAYAVLVSEVMLQQTQVARVVPYYEAWLADFPTIEALAAAPLEAVLRRWQGLGYNRRAVALKRVAEIVIAEQATGAVCEPARLPRADAELRALPGIGPATAAGIRAFAFEEHGVYLETNARTVVIHELFAHADAVDDRDISEMLRQAAAEAQSRGIEASRWNWALLDYGAHLKATMPNPSRRSVHHTRQSPFEGSRRQKRARLLREVLAAPGLTAAAYTADDELGAELLGELVAEGFLAEESGRYRIA